MKTLDQIMWAVIGLANCAGWIAVFFFDWIPSLSFIAGIAFLAGQTAAGARRDGCAGDTHVARMRGDIQQNMDQ